MACALARLLALIFVSSLLVQTLHAQGKGQSRDVTTKGREVLIQALAKRGGVKALRAVKDAEVKMAGKIVLEDGAEASFQSVKRVRYGRPQGFRHQIRVQLQDIEISRRVTLVGKKGQLSDRKGVRPMTDIEVAEHWAMNHRTAIAVLHVAMQPRIKVEYVGTIGSEDELADAIRILRRGEHPLTVEVHRATGYFRRFHWREPPSEGASPVKHELKFSRFEAHCGLKGIPGKAELLVDGKLNHKREVVSMKANLGLKPDDFKFE